MSYSIYNTADTGAAGRQYEGVAVSSTDTYYSEPISGKHADGYGLMLQWTGDPTGTFTLWMSDKPNPIRTSDADWVQDTSFAPTNPAGSASKMRDDAFNAKATWKRVKYVNASGSGTLFGWVNTPRTA